MKLKSLLLMTCFFYCCPNMALTQDITQNVDEVINLKRKRYDVPSSFETTEELVIIQAVSTTGRTFVVRRGRKDGVFPGQESLFSNKTISLVARATEVTNDNSLWSIRDPNGRVPFLKNSFVLYAPTIEKVAVEIPNRIEARKHEVKTRKDSKTTPNSLAFRIGLSRAMYESISETESERRASRDGISVEGIFATRILPNIELGIGGRFDREVATIKDPRLDIPTTRIMVIGEATYFFREFFKEHNFLYYTSVGAGIGRGQTDVNGSISAGLSTVLPYVRIGAERPLGQRFKLLLEFMAESVAMTESFTDSQEQTTNIVNLRFSVGFKY